MANPTLPRPNGMLGARPQGDSSSLQPPLQKYPATGNVRMDPKATMYPAMYYQPGSFAGRPPYFGQTGYGMYPYAQQQYMQSFSMYNQNNPYMKQYTQGQTQYGYSNPSQRSFYPYPQISGYQMPAMYQQRPVKKGPKVCRWQKPLEQREVNQFYSRYQELKNDKQLHLSTPITSFSNGFSNFSDEPPKGFVGQELSATSFIKQNSGEQWPLNLTRFVNKAFDKCINQEERGEIFNALKVIIDTAKIGASLYSKNWDLVPVPKLKRENTITPATSTSSILDRILKNDTKKQEKSPISLPPPVIPDKPPKQAKVARRTHFQTKQPKSSIQDDIKKRKERFGSPKISKPHKTPSFEDLNHDELDLDELAEKMKIVGLSESLEKQFLRLTGPPDPTTIRPPRVLVKSLEMLQRRWKEKGGAADYQYICEQLRSIRQDMAVQGIKDALSVRVYETHARYALEAGDLDHFNQCQSVLRVLHVQVSSPHRMQFVGYGVLYQVLRDIKLEIPGYLKDLDQEMRQHPFVKHAFDVHRALVSQNFLRFFKLYKSAPNLSSKLIEVFIPRVRARALQTCAKSHLLEIDLETLGKLLGYDSKQELIEFIESEGGVMAKNNTVLNSRESLPHFMRSPTLARRF